MIRQSIELLNLSDEQQKALDKLNATLAPLIEAAKQSIADQASLTLSGTTKITLQGYIKSVKAIYALHIDPLTAQLQSLKNAQEALIAPARTALEDLVERQRAWLAEEKQRAAAEARRKQEEIDRQKREKAEQDRRQAEAAAEQRRRETVAKINADLEAGLIGKREAAKRLKEAGAEEEAAKATAAAVAEEEKNRPAPTVVVQPAIPKVAGIRNQTYYYAAVLDGRQIIAALLAAAAEKDADRMEFLRRFVTVDETEVNKYARETKDSEAVKKALPGVNAWSRG